MSAYLVSPEHIAEIARFAHKPNKFGFNPYNLVAKHQPEIVGMKGLAQLLLQANVDSLQARYYDHGPIAGGFLNDESEITNYFDDLDLEMKGKTLSAESIYNMVNCLEYQSCESTDWISSDAYWVLHYIKEVAAKEMIKNSTGDHVAWDYEPKREAV
tara:strand:- start:1380 stop:1850 length:471 start_codon:yes stop_codon:yes gene_type:complete